MAQDGGVMLIERADHVENPGLYSNGNSQLWKSFSTQESHGEICFFKKITLAKRYRTN